MIYRKFGWPSQAQFYADIETAGYKSGDLFIGCAVKELDSICITKNSEGVCTDYDTRYAVDIIFYEELPTEFLPFIVWPVPGSDVHCFSGWEQQYATDFCVNNPNDPFCTLATPTE